MWLISAALVMTWVWLDKTPPAWDQGDHLSRAMKHWQMFQQPEWFSGDWWRSLWMKAPTQRAPLTYLLTVPFFNLFGTGFDQGITVNLLFTVILLVSTYAIGRRVFSPEVGLWAAGLSILSPELVKLQKDYMLDYPMTAMVSFMFMGMTYFWIEEKAKFSEEQLSEEQFSKDQFSKAQATSAHWLSVPLWGIGLGLMLMTRTSGLLFAIPPVGWMLGTSLWRRQWLRLSQVIIGVAIAALTLWPWFSTNWLTIISTTIDSTTHGVIYCDDPQANTLSGWLFYPKALPQLMSWPLFCLAAIALTLILIHTFRNRLHPTKTTHFIRRQPNPSSNRRGWIWLSVFTIGAYLLFSIGSNKGLRLFVPCLPILWVMLARAIVTIQNRWWHFLRWAAVGIAIALTLKQLFWQQNFVTIPNGQQTQWKNEAVISEIIQTTPFLRSTLGLAINTAQINAHNLSFYGAAANYQAFARQLSSDAETAIQDSQVLDWYLTKTGEQGAYDTIEEGQQKLREAIETSQALSLHKSWPLPDSSELRLYHRNHPPVSVRQLTLTTKKQISLDQVETSAAVAPGESYPITYTLRGPGKALQTGLLILTWEPEGLSENPAKNASTGPLTQKKQWISDHAIGLGYLNTVPQKRSKDTDKNDSFEVIETLSITPPNGLDPGSYRLRAEYLNRETGEHYTLSNHAAHTQVTASAPPSNKESYQELVTYFNNDLAQTLRDGDFELLFDEVGRINDFEPLQDYLPQAEQAMTYRLLQAPEHIDWLYTLTLAQILQQKSPDAIITLKKLTEVSPQNPYHWAYLGLVHLYQWQPRKASLALNQAEQLQPDLPYLKDLQTVHAAMMLNIPKAVRLLQSDP